MSWEELVDLRVPSFDLEGGHRRICGEPAIGLAIADIEVHQLAVEVHWLRADVSRNSA